MKIVNTLSSIIYYEGIFIQDALDNPSQFLKSLGTHHLQNSDLDIVLSNTERKSILREEIEKNAGDSLSLLGTTSDATQLLLYEFCKLVKGLSSANSLSDVRSSTSSFKDIAESFVLDVDEGKTKLPYQVKGLMLAMDEIATRASAVAEVFEAQN